MYALLLHVKCCYICGCTSEKECMFMHHALIHAHKMQAHTYTHVCIHACILCHIYTFRYSKSVCHDSIKLTSNNELPFSNLCHQVIKNSINLKKFTSYSRPLLHTPYIGLVHTLLGNVPPTFSSCASL